MREYELRYYASAEDSLESTETLGTNDLSIAIELARGTAEALYNPEAAVQRQVILLEYPETGGAPEQVWSSSYERYESEVA